MQSITEQSTMLMMSILNVWIEERFNGIFLGASATRIVSVVVRDNYLLDANVLIQTIIALVNTGDAVVIQELQNEITYQWDEFLDTHNFVLEGEQVAVVEESDSEGDADEDTEEEEEDEELPMCMVCNINRSSCRAGDGEEWVYFCVPCRQKDSDDFKKLLNIVEDV